MNFFQTNGSRLTEQEMSRQQGKKVEVVVYLFIKLASINAKNHLVFNDSFY